MANRGHSVSRGSRCRKPALQGVRSPLLSVAVSAMGASSSRSVALMRAYPRPPGAGGEALARELRATGPARTQDQGMSETMARQIAAPRAGSTAT